MLLYCILNICMQRYIDDDDLCFASSDKSR